MDLIVCDEYYSAIGAWLKEQGELLSGDIKKYTSILTEVANNGIMEGATAEALKEFIAQVQTDLEGTNVKPAFVGSASERFCNNFVSHIDDADKDLY